MKKHLQLLIIILSGEAIFMLPFFIPRLYRSLMLEAWGLTNTQIGTAFAVYGVTSTLSYLFGGAFADKYNPRVLISVSLASTAAVGMFMIYSESPIIFIVCYGMMGVTNVLLMWGALIKTTHVLGGEDSRSTALGILDGGRGLVAAVSSTILFLFISLTFPDLTIHDQQVSALRSAYTALSVFVFLVAILIWFSLKDLKIVKKSEPQWDLDKALASLKNKNVWLLSLVVLSAYCGYKGIDNYAIYFVDVQGISTQNTSKLITLLIWLRPFSAIAFGVFADLTQNKIKYGRFAILAGLLFSCSLTQVLLAYVPATNFYLAFATVITSVTFVYGMRSIYFSVFDGLGIPTHLIGTTVGIASFVGFMPDIFLVYITGRFIDANPGPLGFKYTFLFTAGCLFVGALSALRLAFSAAKK